MALLSVVLLAAAWEWAGFLAPGRVRLARLLFVAAGVVLCAAVVAHFQRQPGVCACVLWAACASVVCGAGLGVSPAPAASGRPWSRVSGLLALSFAWLALARMRIDWARTAPMRCCMRC